MNHTFDFQSPSAPTETSVMSPLPERNATPLTVSSCAPMVAESLAHAVPALEDNTVAPGRDDIGQSKTR